MIDHLDAGAASTDWSAAANCCCTRLPTTQGAQRRRRSGLRRTGTQCVPLHDRTRTSKRSALIGGAGQRGTDSQSSTGDVAATGKPRGGAGRAVGGWLAGGQHAGAGRGVAGRADRQHAHLAQPLRLDRQEERPNGTFCAAHDVGTAAPPPGAADRVGDPVRARKHQTGQRNGAMRAGRALAAEHAPAGGAVGVQGAEAQHDQGDQKAAEAAGAERPHDERTETAQCERERHPRRRDRAIEPRGEDPARDDGEDRRSHPSSRTHAVCHQPGLPGGATCEVTIASMRRPLR